MSGTVHRYRPVPKHFIFQRENRNDLWNEIDKLAAEHTIQINMSTIFNFFMAS
jgi:hypothetical protein